MRFLGTARDASRWNRLFAAWLRCESHDCRFFRSKSSQIRCTGTPLPWQWCSPRSPYASPSFRRWGRRPPCDILPCRDVRRNLRWVASRPIGNRSVCNIAADFWIEPEGFAIKQLSDWLGMMIFLLTSADDFRCFRSVIASRSRQRLGGPRAGPASCRTRGGSRGAAREPGKTGDCLGQRLADAVLISDI